MHGAFDVSLKNLSITKQFQKVELVKIQHDKEIKITKTVKESFIVTIQYIIILIFVLVAIINITKNYIFLGSLICLLNLQMSPVLFLFTEKKFIKIEICILTSASIISLFVRDDGMFQNKISYFTWISIILVYLFNFTFFVKYKNREFFIITIVSMLFITLLLSRICIDEILELQIIDLSLICMMLLTYLGMKFFNVGVY